MSRLPIFTIIRSGPAKGQVWYRYGAVAYRRYGSQVWPERFWSEVVPDLRMGTQDNMRLRPAS